MYLFFHLIILLDPDAYEKPKATDKVDELLNPNHEEDDLVFKISDTLEEDMKLKEVVDVLDEEPIFKLEDLELVNWMKNRYLCTYIDCINLIYPKGYEIINLI